MSAVGTVFHKMTSLLVYKMTSLLFHRMAALLFHRMVITEKVALKKKKNPMHCRNSMHEEICKKHGREDLK